jgi:hypothetical protein
MRSIKLIANNGTKVILEAVQNDLSIGEYIELLAPQGYILNMGEVDIRPKNTQLLLSSPADTLPDGDITLFTLPKDPKGN